MPLFTDQTGRNFSLDRVPKRIISLVPSQTELLADLELHEEVVGITKFCIHPKKWFQTKMRVGGTREIRLDMVASLRPDLIIANKEENVREQVEELSRRYPVWVSQVSNLDDACQMIEQTGLLTQRIEKAGKIVRSIRKRFDELKTNIPAIPNHKIRTSYLIWQNPYMTAGGDTFIHSMLETLNYENIFGDQTRYPEVTITDLRRSKCELLLLPSEPFPFKQKHVDVLRPLLPNTPIMLVDGEMFSWYGSHLLQAPGYFMNLHKQVLAASRF